MRCTLSDLASTSFFVYIIAFHPAIPTNPLILFNLMTVDSSQYDIKMGLLLLILLLY